MPASLFDELGGLDAISAAVDRFYARVTADPALAPFFAGVDLDRLKRHQRMFLAAALRGPHRYDGRTMRAAHAGLQITDDDFDRVAGHLAGALEELAVRPDLIARVLDHVAPLRADIVEVPPMPPSEASRSGAA